MSFQQEFAREFDEAEGVEKALFAIAIAIDNLATQVKYLGTGDAASTMGAIEFLATHLGEKLEGLVERLDVLTDAISDK